ncbi:ATP-binding protein, partial [Candidatus Poribacteria bacterium]
MDSSFVRLKQLVELAKEVGVDQEEWFLAILRRLLVRWNPVLYQKTMDILISRDNRPILDNTFPVPTRPDDLEAVDGQFKIGTIANTNVEFGFTPLQLQMHGVIGGQSGFGKTTLIKVLGQQIMAEGNTKVWFIDPKEGGDYRSLVRQFQDLLVLRPDMIRCNPFNMIENVPVKMLKESVIEVTADSFAVYDASEAVIAEHVHRIFQEHEQPNLYDFINSVWNEKVKYGGRRAGYIDTIKSRLTKIQISLEDIVDCKTDYFSELYDRDVIFEIGSLSGSAQRILVPWLIMKLVLYKIKNPTPHLSHLLVFDEAQAQIWSRYLEMRGRQSYMATLATQARAFGLGLLVLCQEPSMKLMREITANSCIKVAFHLGDGDEVQGFGRSMGLNYDQMNNIHHFRRGEVICRVGLGYTEPIRLDLYNFQDKPVSDDELIELMKPKWDALLASIKPAWPEEITQDQLELNRKKRTAAAEKPKASKKGSKSETSSDVHAGVLRTPAGPALSQDEQAYLRVVSTHPWLLIKETYRLLNDEKVMGTERIGQTKAVSIRKKLLAREFLEGFPVSGTGKSGKHQCDVVTEKAGLGKVQKPRGGYLHAWWCYRICEFFRHKSAEVKVGDTISGNECDIGISMDGKRIGVEVVVSGLVVDNLTRYISKGYYHEVLVLCINDEKKKAGSGSAANTDAIFRPY